MATVSGFRCRDHHRCIADTLAVVEQRCSQQGARLTPMRRRVLEILLAEHRALGAYAILERLQEEGRRAQPPIAYRALDFLVSQGFVHRIERLNAFVACNCPQQDHPPAFLICRGCRKVAEIPDAGVENALGSVAGDAGFRIEKTSLEAEGLCPDCRQVA